MDTLVVGAGAIGRWFADILDGDIAFTDLDADRASEAADRIHRQSGRQGRSVPLETAESFGLVTIAVPLSAAVPAIEQHGSKAQTAVIDLTGAMEAPLEAMARVAPARERASYHPLFAPNHGPGRVAVSQATEGPTIDRIHRSLEEAGNDLISVDASTHDAAMTTIQGRAHAAVLAFGIAADDVPDELATPVFDQLLSILDRVTDGNPQVYQEIQDRFGGADEVAAAATRLAEADQETFERLYNDAKR